MTVWIVGVSDCESNSTICICSTKELAEKKLFEERDRLVAEWKERIKPEKASTLIPNKDIPQYNKMTKKLYSPMIKALSGNNYEKWNNYPHEVPYISQMEVLESQMNNLPKEMTVCRLECLLMPNGEIVCHGETIGFFKDFKKCLEPSGLEE